MNIVVTNYGILRKNFIRTYLANKINTIKGTYKNICIYHVDIKRYCHYKSRSKIKCKNNGVMNKDMNFICDELKEKYIDNNHMNNVHNNNSYNNFNTFYENGNNKDNFNVSKKCVGKKVIRDTFINKIKEGTLSLLNLEIEELNYEELLKYKNIKKVVVMKNKLTILKYFNSYLLKNNKGKYYILKVLMFCIVKDIHKYKNNELIYILYIYKYHNYLNPFLILHIIDKLCCDNYIYNMNIKEFVFLLDILNVPLVMTNKFIQNIMDYININQNKIKYCKYYFDIAYFLARNNLYNKYIFDTIAQYYTSHSYNFELSILYMFNNEHKNINRNNNAFPIKGSYNINNNIVDINICEELINNDDYLNVKQRNMLKKVESDNGCYDNTYDNNNIINFKREIHKHLYILSKYGYKNIQIYNNMFKIIIFSCNHFKPFEVSSIFKSLKNINYFNIVLLEKLTSTLKKNISQYKTSLLLDCLNTLSYFNYKDDNIITTILINLPRNISTYTSNQFLKLVYFMDNFIPFSIYFNIFLNKQICIFSSSFGLCHLISLLKIFTHQNLISNPILYLLRIKISKYNKSLTYNDIKSKHINEKPDEIFPSINYTGNIKISYKDIYSIFYHMHLMRVQYMDLAIKCIECIFFMEKNFKNIFSEDIEYITNSCCYFLLLNDNYDDPFLRKFINVHIENFFSFVASNFVKNESLEKKNECINGNMEMEKINDNNNNNKKKKKYKTYNIKMDDIKMDDIKMDDIKMGDIHFAHYEKNNGTIHFNNKINYNEQIIDIQNNNNDKKNLYLAFNKKKNVYAIIILTLINELVYQNSIKKISNIIHNFNLEYIKNNIYVFLQHFNNEKNEKEKCDTIYILEKLFPLLYFPKINNVHLKNISRNNFNISTFNLTYVQNGYNNYLKSEHIKKEIISNQYILNEIYKILRSLKQKNYIFKLINKSHTKSFFLYNHYIYVKNIRNGDKIAILFASKNYYYNTIDDANLGLTSKMGKKIFEKKKFTKEAITQIEYFKIYFNKVYLVEFYTWENMINIQEKKDYLVNLLNI
ncbi:hypothetical protein PFFVO_02135 [Plasmodium falciparum Vietnam Oak-Knoll (FVO)]|uniref:Uncharacterized protein n=1 Tax=Plasmodium falciparum Vietnam Oak-Knoll (FVO) TaxID=1036723 RepID=A0A024V8M7_PLAFA|nr:hypothetical protein PFFVO_02135 [Plasmodium falciparum Vietnam Oak-Knoll (FVO)]